MLQREERDFIRRLHERGHSIRAICTATEHARKTIRNIVYENPGRRPDARHSTRAEPYGWFTASPESYKPPRGKRSGLEPFRDYLVRALNAGPVRVKALLDELRKEGYAGSRRSLDRFLSTQRTRVWTKRAESDEWLRRMLQGAIGSAEAEVQLCKRLSKENVDLLLDHVLTKPLKLRNRALSIMACAKGIRPGLAADFLCLSPTTVKGYYSQFKQGGVASVLDLTRKEIKKVDDPKFVEAVFRVLHQPPSAFGFNRTTWRMEDLHETVCATGPSISKANIRGIIRKAGYRFHKARKVLTSTDPEFREKLERITAILSNLKPDEKFFSIDEFGPFAVKTQGGKALSKSGQIRTVPQFQKSKGSLIVTAALELSTNQVTHFYSAKKDSEEMIRMLDTLLIQYKGQQRIYFSWDAASWHESKRFLARVKEVNRNAYREEHNTPNVKLAPLPASAQFLNVIESVFSGMARAIIHNSDYASVEACKVAIDRYFKDRNSHFRSHPQRAGKKIWGKERVPAVFAAANNCKDPRW